MAENGNTMDQDGEDTTIMQHTITPRHVMAVIIEVDKMLKQGNFPFNTVEVMLGLQELVGRIIVDMATTKTSADELVVHAKRHLDNTIRIGMQAKGQSALTS
jgi:hypothetical protein